MSFFAENITKSFRSSHRRCYVKKGFLRNFPKFTGKHLCLSLFFNKVAGLSPKTLLKKRLWHRSFPVNFAKFLRTPLFYILALGDCFWFFQFFKTTVFGTSVNVHLCFFFMTSCMLKHIKVLVLVKSVTKIKHFWGLSGLFTNRFLFIVFTNCTNLSTAPQNFL